MEVEDESRRDAPMDETPKAASGLGETVPLREFESIQSLSESLNRFIPLGGNDHIDRQQTGSGRERSESLTGVSTTADAN